MKYLTINYKEYFQYEEKDFIKNKWYIITDNGAEGAYISKPFNSKRETTFEFCSPFKRESKGIYRCGRSWIMSGKAAIDHGFTEYCFDVTC
jgi:hypothetical protein